MENILKQNIKINSVYINSCTIECEYLEILNINSINQKKRIIIIFKETVDAMEMLRESKKREFNDVSFKFNTGVFITIEKAFFLENIKINKENINLIIEYDKKDINYYFDCNFKFLKSNCLGCINENNSFYKIITCNECNMLINHNCNVLLELKQYLKFL